MTPEELELLRRYLASQPNLGPTATPALTPYQQIMSRMTPTANPYMQQPTVTGGYNPALFSRNTGASGLLSTPYAPPVNDRGSSRERDPADQARINAFMDAEDAKDIANGDPVGTTRGARITNDLGFLSVLNPFSGIMALGDGLKAFVDPRDTSNTSFGSNIGRSLGNLFGTGPGYESGPSGRLSETAQTNLENAQPGDRYAAPQTFGDSDPAGGGYANAPDGYGGGSRDAGGGGFGRGGENYSGGGGYAMGGMVNNLFGPNPSGPDDGTGFLQRGEYVIKKSAVDKMPKGLLDMINSGKMPMKKSKSLIK